MAARQQPCLSVFGGDYPREDGTGVRDYIHVMDLAKGHAAALNFLSQATGWHAINLGTGQGYSVLNMIQAFEKASGCQVPYQIVARRAGDGAACYANPHKARECLNWRARRSLGKMCASTWRFQQSQSSRLTLCPPKPRCNQSSWAEARAHASGRCLAQVFPNSSFV